MSYDKLCEIHEEIALLTSTQATLSWDQKTFLPTQGVSYLSKQLSYLATKIHQLSTSSTYNDALKAAEDATYDLPILLRFWIERMMINGKVATKNIPGYFCIYWLENFNASQLMQEAQKNHHA